MAKIETPWLPDVTREKRKRPCPICGAQPNKPCWSRTKPVDEGYEHKAR